MRAQCPPASTWVVLGASNVSLALAELVAIVLHDDPRARLLVAAGHGRSFGLPTSVLGRSLGPLREASTFSRLAVSPPAGPLGALLFDPGNDLVYGVRAAIVQRWIVECAERLSTLGARLVLGLPPLASLETLGPLRFTLARSLLFPRHRVERRAVLEEALALHHGLADWAKVAGVATLDPPRDWYGLDPVHVRRQHRLAAFAAALAPLRRDPAPVPDELVRTVRHALRDADFSECRRFGTLRRRAQPCVTFDEGGTLTLD